MTERDVDSEGEKIRIDNDSGRQAAEGIIAQGDVERGRGPVSGYHLHVGPSVLPRQPRGEPMSLAEALYRAYCLRYAVVYRFGEDGRPVPVVADAGCPGEVIHVPSGRRIRRRRSPCTRA